LAGLFLPSGCEELPRPKSSGFLTLPEGRDLAMWRDIVSGAAGSGGSSPDWSGCIDRDRRLKITMVPEHPAPGFFKPRR
jgi:hypothetical protein